MSASQTTPARDAVPPPGDASTHTLSAAYELLKQWTDISATDDLEALGPAAVYKTSVVLWLMLFQRLNPRASLRDAVLHFVATAPPELKTHKRLREGRLSTGTAGFSDARHRLTLATARWFEEQVAASIMQSTPPAFGSQRVFLIGLRQTLGHDDHSRANAGAATAVSPGVEPAWGKRLARGPDRDRA